MNLKESPVNRCDHGKQGNRGCSYRMQDPQIVFDALALKGGNCFLDIGCGPGDYTIHAARIVGPSGMVHGVDRSESLVADLRWRAAAEGISNIVATATDATMSLPIEEGCVDVCLVATMLHIPDVARKANELCAEIRRVLKPDGRLAVIECHKQAMPFGPPQHIRLSPEETKGLIGRSGFRKIGIVDLGYNYLITFRPV